MDFAYVTVKTILILIINRYLIELPLFYYKYMGPLGFEPKFPAFRIIVLDYKPTLNEMSFKHETPSWKD